MREEQKELLRISINHLANQIAKLTLTGELAAGLYNEYEERVITPEAVDEVAEFITDMAKLVIDLAEAIAENIKIEFKEKEEERIQ